MTTNEKLLIVPAATQEILLNLKEAKSEDLYHFTTALREAGWPLRAIAEVFPVSRVAVSKWALRGDPSLNTYPVHEPPIVDPSLRTKASKKCVPTEEEAEQLKTLATSASSVRRYTGENSLSRLAAEELEEMIQELRDRGATLQMLADSCGVSRSSISQRLRKN